MNALPPGTRLHWYEIGTVIGQGNFGVTYQGMDTNLHHEVAIKEYFPRDDSNRAADGCVTPTANSDGLFEWGLERFQLEAQLLARVQHSNVVRVLSVFPSNGTAYMVMEMARGSTLEDAMRLGLLDEEAALLHVADRLCDGLRHIHAVGILHRDIKPENIMLRPNGEPVLLDFGSARAHMPGSDKPMTSLVTRGYAPYEQYDSDPDLEQGPWTDLYGLGATLYRIVTRRNPTDALARAARLLRQQPDPLPSAVSLVGDRYSTELANAIDRAMAFEPGDRPQSMSEWRDLLPLTAATWAPVDSGLAEVEPAAAIAADHTTTPTLPPPHGTTPAVHPIDLTDERVLVIEDETFISHLLARVLGNYGAHGVEQAERSSTALALIDNAEEHFSLVFSALTLPDASTTEHIAALARALTQARVVLIGSDASELDNAAKHAASERINLLGVLTKPVRHEALDSLLRKAAVRPTSTLEASVRRLDESQLLAGLAGDAIELVYQPVASLTEQQVMGVETLARWRDPTLGLLGPGDFIPLAEATGHIVALSEAIAGRAFAQLDRWHRQGCDLELSLNFTREALGDPELPERLAAQARQHHVDPQRVTIEVPENQLARKDAALPPNLSRLRLLGFGLSADDFGTGGTSVADVEAMPLTELKFDRGCVVGAAGDEALAEQLRTSADAPAATALRTVAKGVETSQEWATARALGCTGAQGYYVSEPLSPTQIPQFVAAWPSFAPKR